MDGSHLIDTDFCHDASQAEPVRAETTLAVPTVLMHPDDVVSDSRLTRAQKREILASWASDARAVNDVPALRQLDNGAVVRVDEVLRALHALDDGAKPIPNIPWLGRPLHQRQRMRSVSWSKIASRRSRPGDDDDDPPPCPAIIARPPHGPLSGGESVDPILAMAA